MIFHAPKGGMCASCLFCMNQCNLDFKSMQEIERYKVYDDDFIIVKCTKFKRATS
jgi:hypothetical protein